MHRLILVSSSALFAGSAGAFFLFVPPLSIATVVLIVVGLMLMFGLGFQTGAQGMTPSEIVGGAALRFDNIPCVIPHIQSVAGFQELETPRNESRPDLEKVA